MDFQTLPEICDYMASFIIGENQKILEPTPGQGNLVRALENYGTVIAPEDFFSLTEDRYDWVVANPPIYTNEGWISNLTQVPRSE
jgi:hypothetical protein